MSLRTSSQWRGDGQVALAWVQKTMLLLLVGLLSLVTCSKEKPTAVDVEPPTVTVLSPPSNISVSGVVIIEVEAEDNEGVVKVEFYIDEILQFTDEEPAWEHSWQTISYANGTKHSILAKAYDRAGNSGHSEETKVVVYNDINDPPTVIIYQPIDSTSYIWGEPISLQGQGWDALGNTLRDEQLSWFSSLDGALGTGAYLIRDDLSVDWHTITLIGTDDRGSTARDSTSIQISTEPELFQLTYDGSFEGNPCWSPNSQYIAYTSNRAGNMDIWVASVAGGLPTQLTADPAIDWGPAWHGSEIVFSSFRSGNPDIWKMPDSGGDPVQVTTDPGWDYDASWSPDGEQIVISSGMGGSRQYLWILPLGAGDSTRLTTEPAYEPDWLLGDIAFRARDYNIYVISVVEPFPVQITLDPAYDWSPSWSPDGDAIAFTSDRSGNWDIWIWSRWDFQIRQLTFYSGKDYDPAWSPDGQWIAFSSDRSGSTDIWVIRAQQ